MLLTVMVAPAGSLAMIGSELRQARKGATVIADLCAEVLLVGVHHQFLLKMEFIFLKGSNSLRFISLNVYNSLSLMIS